MFDRYNPYGNKNDKLKRRDLMHGKMFAIEDGHIFAVPEYPITLATDENINQPNWRSYKEYNDFSTCEEALTYDLDNEDNYDLDNDDNDSDEEVKRIRNRIYDRFTYYELIEKNDICDECKKYLINFFNEKS